VDVALILDARERQFFEAFSAARPKVSIEFVLEELADLLWARSQCAQRDGCDDQK
jgi:hypothetical protein